MKRAHVVLLVVLVAAGVAQAQKIKVTANPDFNLSNYKTYVWDKPLPPGNPFIQQILIDSIEQALNERGLTKVQEGGDLIVGYFALTQTGIQTGYPMFSDSMKTSASPNTATRMESYPTTTGSVYVNLVDGKTKNGLFKGMATQVLKDGPSGNPVQDAKSVEKPIRNCIAKIFKKVPGSKQ